jgi:hypothetical protein
MSWLFGKKEKRCDIISKQNLLPPFKKSTNFIAEKTTLLLAKSGAV